MQVRKTGGKIRLSELIVTLVLLTLFHGCGAKGVYHRVRKGQNLYRIALTYGVSLDDLVEVNRIDDPFMIERGALIFIPGAEKVLEVPVITPPAVQKKAIFIYPVRGRVTGRFGERRRGHYHKGVDISAPGGTKVLAASSGKVIYTGSGFSGYGNTVIIDHKNGYITLYAHLSRISTRKGRRVRRGQGIGRVGRTGRATGYHLHFEVRYRDRLVNPVKYLR